MTKKDYILLAEVVKDWVSKYEVDKHDFPDTVQLKNRIAYEFERYANELSDALEIESDYRFDRDRFLKACGFED